MDCNLRGSSVHGMLQAKILEWVAVSYSRGIFLTQESNLGLLHCRWILHHLSHQGSPFTNNVLAVQLLGSVQLFWDPMDCSLPGSSVYGIPQARILEWVIISFSRRSS